MPGARTVRDTDADWKALGASQPYWGVLTHPDYLSENLTPERLEAFYGTGRDYIAGIVEQFRKLTGAAPSGAALDFGCGTGRLAEAMTAYAGPVTGYDISPGMLAEARKRGGKAQYTETLPGGPFDWINSFIVFQHIPPERGMALLEELLGRLAARAFVSLHLTVWRDDHLVPAEPRGWRKAAAPALERLRSSRLKPGAIMMYDYDLSAVVRLLNRAGIGEMSLVSTDHGGHHGVIIVARRSA